MFLVILIILLGLIAGTVGSLVGLGGGVFIVPGLLLLGHFFTDLQYMTPQIAVGTSLIVVIFSAAGSTIMYSRKGKIDVKSGLFFFAASGPGAILGAYLNQFLNGILFNLIFGAILAVILYFLVQNKKMKPQNIQWHVTREFRDSEGKVYEYGYHRYVALAVCFIVGIIQGLLGIGGGALLVPVMILLFWFPTQLAIATSMFVILLSSLTGSVSHIAMGNIAWSILLILAPSAWLGGQLGAFISEKISSRKLSLLLQGIIVLLAINALYHGIVDIFHLVMG